MKWLFALALTLLASTATAGTVFSGPLQATVKSGANYPYRKIRLCLIPDTQNLTNAGGEDTEIILHNAETSCALNPGGVPSSQTCIGARCDASRYCDNDWGKTGQILVNNMSYEMTGQYDKIEWNTINGVTNPLWKQGVPLADRTPALDDPVGDTSARSHWVNQHSGVSGCDAIIGLGDITDEGEIADAAFETKTPQYQHNWTRSRTYWDILMKSNIPAIPNRGNHDAANVFSNWLLPAIGFSSKSYFYAEEPSRKIGHAIRIPKTNTGKPLCIVSNNLGNVAGAALPVNNTEMAWVNNTAVGCGATDPTIVVAHDLVTSATNHDAPTGGAVPAYDTIITAHPEIFLMLGGHYLFDSVAGISGANVIHIYSNFQEEPRHDVPPDGWTGRDSGGVVWRAVIIDPRYSKVVTYDWSPYWEASGAFPSYYVAPAAGLHMSRQTLSFNYDARFP